MLDRILAEKGGEVERSRSSVPLADLKARIADAPPVRSFREALAGSQGSRHRVIAEIKRGSPSKGVMRADLDAAAWAEMYRRCGAAAISVLTDGPFFHGSLADMVAARSCGGECPILRKDFLLDIYQVYEARCHGADAVLLIVRALDRDGLRRLLDTTWELGMEALVEVYREQDLDVALGEGARVVGINNRDLQTFEVDTAATKRLMAHMPEDVVGVSASGIQGAEQILSLELLGVRAFLIGEALVTASDPGEKLREMVA